MPTNVEKATSHRYEVRNGKTYFWLSLDTHVPFEHRSMLKYIPYAYFARIRQKPITRIALLPHAIRLRRMLY